MKVLHIEAGRHLYGGALQVVFLLRGLRAAGVDSVLACPPGSAIAPAAAAHATVHELAMGGDLDLGLVGRLRRLIRAERPDLVHLHSRRGSDVLGALAARLEGVPVVLSRRVDNPEPRAWVALKYRLHDRIVTISEGIRRVLRAEGVPEAKLVCVPSAVDTTAYAPIAADHPDRAAVRAELGLAPDTLLLVMAAQFIARKGHRTLLAALPGVLARHPRARVLLLGRGPLHEAIVAEARAAGLHGALPDGGPVLFPGFRDDLPRLLPACDLMVHPAEMEGLGVALLQAAACGLPIVAGRAGGIPEIVRPGLNGELIEPGDAAALAQHLTNLLGDPALRARYGAAGRQLVLDEFSVDAMVDGNLAVYRACVGAAPG
ncbi:glycosyltransferase [Aquariibacter albus]|uniref:Glycosyltransferase n=1 Tax=Aquariibacter albus TaxID=2759899 RepID=A0A839HMR9_9BURK|nr:glycosyltransferase [Aquariibacter albus]MBB1160670.1 glycosyltransferase [Aquariibacter albus]